MADKRAIVVGSGGREFTFVKRFLDEGVKVLAIPGNDAMDVPGVERYVLPVPGLSGHQYEDYAAFQRFFHELYLAAKNFNPDFVLFGPEDPICMGGADYLHRKGVPTFAPSQQAAMLESSKIMATRLLNSFGVPTAELYKVVTFQGGDNSISLSEGAKYIKERGAGRIVVKGDSLAAGKAVIVSGDVEELVDGLETLLTSGELGNHTHVSLMERLYGRETSAIAISDGVQILPLISVKDHKAVFDGDNGPNTGGMGTYAPNPNVDSSLSSTIYNNITRKIVSGMYDSDMDFMGFLYAGLMITDEGPKVLEINVRGGDPETEVQVPMLKSSFYDMIRNAANGNLNQTEVEWHEGACHCLTLASGGYPGPYEKGKPISVDSGLIGLDTEIVYAGVKKGKDGQLLTNGGRVAYLVTRAPDLASAAAINYALVECHNPAVHFDNMHFRRDVGREI